MKHNFLTLLASLVLGAMMIQGCSYDDSALKDRVDDLDGRLTELEAVVADMNTNIGTLIAAVEALKNNDYITDVHRLQDGKGLSVTFSKSGTYVIRDGESPVVGVAPLGDGNYYWTLDGEFILVDGEKVPASSKTLVPQIKVEDNKFMMSFDGNRWEEIGTAGGAGIFKNVIDGTDSVTFQLSDGSEIVIPKEQKFALQLDYSSVAVLPATQIEVPYTVIAADEGTLVRAYAQGGFQVLSVNAESSSKGTITVKVPDPVPANGEIMAMAVNSKGVASFRILTFEKGTWTSEPDKLKVGAAGGEILISVATNFLYDVIIPQKDKGWLKVEVGPVTKAVRKEMVKLVVSQNKGAERKSEIKLAKDGNVYATYTITQEEAVVDDTPGYKSNIDDWVSNGSVDF